MSRYNENEILRFLKSEIPLLADRDVIFQYLESRLKNDDRNGSCTENLLNFVVDGLEVLEIDRRLKRDPFDSVVDLAAYFASAILYEDEKSCDKLTDREFDDVKSQAVTAADIVDAIEELKSRGGRDGRGYRDDRDRGRGRNSYREERGGSSGRYSQSNRRDSNRYEDRGSSRRGGGYYDQRDDRGSSGRYSRGGRERQRSHADELRNDTVSEASDYLVSKHERARKLREAEGAQSRDRRDEQPSRRNRDDREPLRTPNPNRANGARSYEQVEPEDLKTASSWQKEKDNRKRSGLPAGDGPISGEDMREGIFNLQDPDVIMAVPVAPKSLSARKFGVDVYEIDEVRPEWYISEIDGYRHLRYIPLTDAEKEEVRREIHKLPLVSNEFGDIRQHPQNDKIRTALTRNRFDIDGAKNVHQTDLEKWNESIEAIKEENRGLPETEQREVPTDVPVGQVPVDQVIKLRTPVKGFGMDHVKVLANQRAAKTTESMGDHFIPHLHSIQFRAESYKPLFTAHSEDKAASIVQALGMFAISDAFKVVDVETIWESVNSVTQSVPVPVISALRRHIVQTINNVFKFEMGSELHIETFDDLKTLGDDLINMRGREYTELFARAFGEKMINLQFLTVGSGVEGTDEAIDRCTVYGVVRADVVIVPMVAKDLSLSPPEGTAENEVFIIDREATPRLAKVVNALSLNKADHLAVRQMLLFSDNNIAEIRNDFIGKRAGVIQLITEQE